jgi:hypothetical protein
MTTAKPQPQTSDDADDLIAQLARLMASEGAAKAKAAEAKADEDATVAPQPAPAAPSAQPFSFRLPGDPAPTPRAAATPQAQPQTPAARPPLSSFDSPQPFRFDFDMPRSKPTPEPVQQQAPVVSAPVAAAPAPTRERFMAPDPQPAAPSAGRDPIDAIGELIAAELATASSSLRSEPQQAAPAVSPEIPMADPERQEPEFDTPATTEAREEPAARPAPVERIVLPPMLNFGRSRQQPAAPVEPEAPETFDPQFEEPADEEPKAAEVQPQQRQRTTPVVAAPAAAQTPSSDPIADIESLIGAAVRVRLEGNADQAPNGAPQPVAPRVFQSGPPPSAADLIRSATAVQTAREQARVASAEDAIIAAAAASGANVGWADPGEEALPQGEEYEPQPARRRGFHPGMLRPIAGPAIAVAFLVAAGVGLYTVLGSAGTQTGAPPVLQADATPVREAPPPVDPSEASTASVVFNTAETVEPTDETLVSRDQSEPTDIASIIDGDVSEEGLVNRRVRTVTVRPDGTIVGGDAALAGASLLPVDRPNVPEVPGANTDAPELIAAANAAEELPDTALGFAPDASTTASVPQANVTPLIPGQAAPVVDATGSPVAGRTAPVPMLPITRPSVATSTPSADTAALAPAATLPTATPQPAQPVAAPATPVATAPAAPATPPAASNAAAYVQLASQRTPAEAETTRQQMTSRFGSLFNGAQLEIQQVDLGARGTYYRVRLPANSLADATAICNQVKANGGDCFAI